MAGRVEESVWDERREWIRRQRESGLPVARFCRDKAEQARLRNATRRILS